MWPSVASLVYYVGIGTQAVLAVLLGQRLGVRPRVAIAIIVCYLLGMVPGAKILFNVHQGTFALTGLLRQDFYLQGLWGGPLVYLALAVPAVWLMTRKSPEPRVLSAHGGKRQFSVSSPQSSVGPGLDLIALTAPVPMAIAKLACLCAGCCYGRQTGLPWAITFPAQTHVAPTGEPLHPTQIYDSLLLLATAGLLIWVNRPYWRGTLLLWFIAAYGLARLLTEFTRLYPAPPPAWGPLTHFQWLCAAASVISATALILYHLLRRVIPAAGASPTAGSAPAGEPRPPKEKTRRAHSGAR